MADNTKIEWCDSTWNPITGCTPVSEACQHCYAANIAKRFWGDRKFSDIRFHRRRMLQPLNWRKPRLIFVCSMGDLFHESVGANWIDSILEVAESQPRHTFLFLTKRPSRMANWKFPDNCWLGVTAENQKRADERIPTLLQIPAAVRFVSIEPMLGDIKLSQGWVDYLEGWATDAEPDIDGSPIPVQVQTHKLGWVICGAETGPGARYMQRKWALDLHKQCRNAGVPFFFKKAPRGEGYKLPREFPAGR